MLKKKGLILVEVMFSLSIFLITISIFVTCCQINYKSYKYSYDVKQTLLNNEEELILTEDYYANLLMVLQ